MSEEIEIIFPIDENLRKIIPENDKILCSTMANGNVTTSTITSKKVTSYDWTTPLLLTDNGVAFVCAKEFSSKPIHYLPWGFVIWVKPRIGRWIEVKPEAGDYNNLIRLKPFQNMKLGRKKAWDFFDRFKPIWEQRLVDLEESIIKNIINLDRIPKYEFYTVDFDFVPKSRYKKAVKKVKKMKKSK